MKTRTRRIVGRLLLAVLAPLVVVTAVETALRFFDAGRPTTFLTTWRAPDGPRWVDNQFFGLRFFSPWMTRTPAPISALKSKTPGTIRVVVLGESAALGEPSPEFGPSRHLEAILRSRFPDRKFEVINAAMTAINSHVIREIARDVRVLQPDVAVIYMGNNEIVGPFGPGTVMGSFSGWDGVVRLRVLATRLRLAQWLRRWTGVGGSDGDQPWGGLEMFAKAGMSPRDARLDVVRRRFKSNLRDTIDELRAGGAQVILCTMAVNLGDCPPFASAHRDDLQPQQKEEWDRLYAEGCAAEDQGRWPAAWAVFERAATIDDQYAELQYRIGLCRKAMGDEAYARRAFLMACDLDALRFRADSGMNAMIMAVASGEGEGVKVRDIDAVFAAKSPAEIPGAKLFLDHVHFTQEGARLWAESVAGDVAQALQLGEAKTDGGDDLIYTDGDAMTAVDTMIERMKSPPFSNQLLNEHRLKSLVDIKLGLLDRLAMSDLTATRRRYDEAMQREPGDWWLPWVWGRILDRAGRYDEAVNYLSKALALVPHRLDAQGELALILAHAGRLEDAVRQVHVSPGAGSEIAASVMLAQAQMLAREGAIPAAGFLAEAAFRMAPDSPFVVVQLSEAYLGAGRKKDALNLLKDAVARGVDTASVLQELGMLLAVEGKPDESEMYFSQALKKVKDGAEVRMQRALSRLYARNERGALEDLEALVKEQPDNALAYQHLGWVRRAAGDMAGAEAAFNEALRCAPGSASVRIDLARVAAAQGREADALLNISAACELEPDRPDYMLELARRLLAAKSAPGGLDVGRAYVVAQRACTLTGYDDPQLLDVLAAAAAVAEDSKMLEQESMAKTLSGRGGERAAQYFMERLIRYRQAAKASKDTSSAASR